MDPAFIPFIVAALVVGLAWAGVAAAVVPRVEECWDSAVGAGAVAGVLGFVAAFWFYQWSGFVCAVDEYGTVAMCDADHLLDGWRIILGQALMVLPVVLGVVITRLLGSRLNGAVAAAVVTLVAVGLIPVLYMGL